jgi:hypothetical protein
MSSPGRIEVAFVVVRKLDSQGREVRLVWQQRKSIAQSGFVHQGDVVA